MSREFVVNALKLNNLNIVQTNEYLKKPSSNMNEKMTFNSSDDHVIKYMKDSPFYKELVDMKGRENVADRDYYLN